MKSINNRQNINLIRRKRILKNPNKVNLNKLLRFIDKEYIFSEKILSINKNKLYDKFST